MQALAFDVPNTRRAMFAALYLGVSGCVSSVDSSLPIVRDSAGVVLTEFQNAPGSSAPRWELTSTPQALIGVSDGDEPYQLFRVAAAVRSSDGHIVVLNGGTNEVRIFDETGRFLRNLGGSGAGPGEFGAAQHMWLLPEDSIEVYDGHSAQWHVFDPTGAFVRSSRVNPEAVVAAGVGRRLEGSLPLPNGGFLTGAYERGISEEASTPIGQPYRTPFEAILISPDVAAAVVLGDYADVERASIAQDGRRGVLPVRFGARYQRAVGGVPTRLALSNSDEYNIRVFGGDGRLRQVIRSTHPPTPVARSDIDVAKQRYLIRALERETRQAAEREWAAVPIRKTFPAHGPMFIDRASNVWIANWPMPADTSQSWVIISSRGEVIGTLESPLELMPLDIGGDYVLGITHDVDRIERVALYGLTRS